MKMYTEPTSLTTVASSSTSSPILSTTATPSLQSAEATR